MKQIIFILMLVQIATFQMFFSILPCSAQDGEIETNAADQTDLSVTIYNQDMALIKEQRSVTLPKGEVTLAIRDVSGRIIPETALLSSDDIRVLEQNFEFDLLTPESLLKKFTGKTIKIIRENRETGQEKTVEAKVLSTHNGIVLETGSGIETGLPGRLVFSHIPGNLRTSPTLTMTVQSIKAENRNLALSYLTHGLSWKADYVAELNPDDDRLNLSAWVTLTNTSSTDYTNARLQLVAGDIHLAPQQNQDRANPLMMRASAMAEDGFVQEQMFEYHLYTLGRQTTLKNNQTKQVALLQAENIPCQKEYRLSGNGYWFARNVGDGIQRPKVEVLLNLENSKNNNLGMPLPKGTVRVYKTDTRGMLQFAGEDNIDHTPEGGRLNLKLGNAFDITVEKRQTDFRKLPSTGQDTFQFQSSHDIRIMNAKKVPVTVKIYESMPGDWHIQKESHPHKKETAHQALWEIQVPPENQIALTYTVKTK
ncbi:DUF4139 domain-containing protein [Desulforapulum autotrophicum]|nr:DUF4139 domain-containing protein [Desulforapulum autotrophicum]